MQRPQIRYVILLLGISLVGWNSYTMAQLPFWGYRPLGWILGLYGIFLFFFWPKMVRTEGAVRRLLLSTGTGLMLGLSFPESPLLPMVLVAWVPLLYVALQRDLKFWSLLGHAYHSFFLWNVIATFWVMNSSLAAGLVANGLNAFLMTFPWMLFYFLRQKTSSSRALVGLVAFWMSFEYVHLHWEISWPWLNLGHYFAGRPDWVQWYEWTGCFGGTLWIWVVNLLVFCTLTKERKPRKTSFFLVLAVVLIPIIFSYIIKQFRSVDGTAASVVLVQPNYDPHYEKFDIPESQQLRTMMALARREVDTTTDFLLLPETVVNQVLLNRIEGNPSVRKMLALSSEFPRLNIISGMGTYRTYRKDSLYNENTRIHVSGRGDTTYWDVQNATVWMSEGRVRGDYFKSKLVPGPEIFPYRWLFFFLNDVVDALGGSKEGLRTQSEREVFGVGNKKVAPAICYESIYGECMGAFVKAGANALFVVTNDGWWDDTPGHRQHLAMSRLRAIETRRYVARAANTGISCFIDARGRVYQPTEYGVEDVVRGEIKMREGMTFYVRYGDYLAKMALLISLLYLVAMSMVAIRTQAKRRGFLR